MHSLHYVAPSRGSVEILASSLPVLQESTRNNESTRTIRYESTTTINEYGLLKNVNSEDKNLSSFSGSDNGSNDGTIIERSKGRNMSTVPHLLSSKVVALDAWKPSVLIVDDSKMNRKMLVRMLISKGFACREAEDGMEGLSEMSRLDVPSEVATRMNFNMFSGTLSCFI